MVDQSMKRHFAWMVTVLCGATFAVRGWTQELEIPAYFSLYVSEASELHRFAPPHPCGRVLTLRSSTVPVDLTTFKIYWALELSNSGDVLARWPLPVDATPVGVMRDRLTIRMAGSGESVYLLTSGRIGLPVEGAWPEESQITPDHVGCPSSLDDAVSQYFCVALSDQSNGSTRVIAYPPICT
jgi:hypothetical protein